MKLVIRRFIFNLLVITLSLTCLAYGIFHFLLPGAYFSSFPVIPAVLFTVTSLVHIYLVTASKGDPGKFISKYLGAMGIKILLYLLYIVVFLFFDRANAIPFLVSFLAMYAGLTVFEVISILNTLKNKP